MERTTYTVDLDTLTVAFADGELATLGDARRAIDEIAERVEAELEARGIDADVERRYDSGPRRDGGDIDPTVWDAVLIDRVDDLRAAVLG